MKIILVADTFPPLRTSGAVQLRDLSREFINQGHDLTVCLPDSNQQEDWLLEKIDGIQILRLKAPKTKDVSYFRRTVNEFLMPFAMIRSFKKSPMIKKKWDGVLWYSPSIFHGPFVSMLKLKSSCRGYLIIRDIFPEWALDMKLIGRGFPYLFFRVIASYQYSIANFIGVQSFGNKIYFNKWEQKPFHELQVLNNWLGKLADTSCSIRLSETIFADRKVFVYAGNMGVAQDMDMLVDLTKSLEDNENIGFLFVGRGSEIDRLKDRVDDFGLTNILFSNEIHPDEIPNLYAQCDIGMVSLDSKHKSHNIPGKFLTYMQNGLPVLATINSGNDLAKIIRDEKVGQVCESNNLEELNRLAKKLLNQIESDDGISDRCSNLFEREFSASKAVNQIINAFNSNNI